jgi:hypothetical protein
VDNDIAGNFDTLVSATIVTSFRGFFSWQKKLSGSWQLWSESMCAASTRLLPPTQQDTNHQLMSSG